MKRLTLILSMMIALIGFNANAEMYIVGNGPFGDWMNTGGVQMTDNGNGIYTYTATVNGTVYFLFGDGMNTDWGVFNPNYRIGPTGGSDQAVNAGEWTTAQKAPDGSKSYKFTGTGGDYVFTFDYPNMKFKVEGYVEPIVINTYSVAGEPASIFGAEWSNTNTATEMTLVNGLYTWTAEGVELTSGTTVKFKIVGNHDWGFAWPDEDYLWTVPETGTYDLEFTINPDTKEVGFNPTKLQDGPEVDPLTGHLYVVGQVNNNGWNPSTAVEMTAGENNVFTLTDAVITDAEDGYGFFSFMSKLGENANDWPNDYRIGATENGYVVTTGVAAPLGDWAVSCNNAFKALAGYYDITVDLTAGTVLLVAKEAPQPTVDPVYIMGNVNDYTWDAINGVQMTYDETAKVYTANINVANVNNGLGYFGFSKMLGDTTLETDVWDQIAPYRFGPMCDPQAENWTMTENLLGVNCELDMESSKSIEIPAGAWTVTVDLNNNLFKIEGTWPTDTVEPETTPDVYIIGDVNNIGWSAVNGVQMTYNEGIYTAEITTQNQGDLGIAYFGFTKMLADTTLETDVWDQIAPYRFGPVSEGAFVMTEALLDTVCALATDGSYNSIAIPEGTWTVTVDLENHTFKINGTWPTDTVEPEPTPDVYIIGDVNNIGWSAVDGVQMTYNEGIYTAEITTQNQGDLGIAYFGFTKMLADTTLETDVWDQIAPYRFGPVSEGAFVMTETLLDTDCALATDGSYNSIAIPEGTWTVTVDLENHTFKINGTWPIDTVVPEPYTGDVYILGEVNDNGGWFPNIGSQMTRDAENNVYTAIITTIGENDGYSYFSFTKMLSENTWENGGWDEIAGYRFGAEQNDFEVTEELLGQQLNLVNYANAFKISAGKWKLTLSVDDMTLVIEKVTGLRGDVDDNQVVDINDVTRLIDVVLGKDVEYNATNADCNVEGGDGDVNINDITALIGRVLNGAW